MTNSDKVFRKVIGWAGYAALLAGTALVFGCSCGGAPQPVPSGTMAAAAGGQRMTVAELKAMPKIDAHTHINGLQDAEIPAFIACLDEYNIKWMTICTEGLKWKSLQAAITLAEKLHAEHPERVAWATSFNLTNWGDKDWQSQAIATIKDGFDHGAVAVKFYKEIGMWMKDPDSSNVMVNDPRFDLLFDFIQQQGKSAVMHIGEPRNCWLPLDSMTVNNDRQYYTENPQEHAFLHPEMPGYWKQIASRDSVLAHHPNLRVVGCHLGSLEFDVDEMAKRFDLYPNFAVDMAARICHFQVQDRGKVRAFMIKYQDRLLYGTDLVAGREFSKMSIDSCVTKIAEAYDKDMEYFATADSMQVQEVNGKFQGLELPADVLKKIFHDNAEKWYPGI